MADELQQDTGGAPGLTGLDRIALEASGIEQEAAEKENALLNPEPENPIDQAQLWAQIPLQLGGLLSMALPELKGVYTPDKCLAWGQGMAAVSEKYGWDAGETISRFAPEFMLVAATIPLALPTVQAFGKRRRAAEKARQVEKERQAANAGAETPSGTDAPANPMMQEPGGFSEPH